MNGISENQDVRGTVRERYEAIAEGRSAGCCGTDCGCNGGSIEGVLEQIGYTPEQIAAIPPESNLGLGCGSPLAIADASAGEVVLDLGSGAGLDVFLAARAVGPSGRVIGVDMTPEMIDRSRAMAAKLGLENVEFRQGVIEDLPVDDGWADIVISNGVINLVPDKLGAYREIARVLKPNGRVQIADICVERPVPESALRDIDLWTG